jgi:cell division transport system permease protein
MSAWLRHHLQSLASTLRRLASAPLATLLNMAVMGIALALPLGGYVVLANLQGLLESAPAAEQISIFFDSAASREDARAVEERLRSEAGVRDVRFVSRDAALAALRRSPQLGEVVSALRQNPLPDAVVVTLASTDGAAADRLAATARQFSKVSHVQSDAAWARRLDALLALGRSAVALLAGLLGIGLVAVVFNTIRLQIVTQRPEIEVARLVGATDAFIRRPFYYWGAVQGVLGGALAWGIVAAALALLDRDVVAVADLYGGSFRLQGPALPDALALLVFAGLLGWLGAYLSVSRHLLEMQRQ